VNFLHLIWLIPALPMAGFVFNGLLGKRFLPRQVVAGIACLTVLGSFILSVGAIRDLHDEQGLADLLNSGDAVSAIGAMPAADGFGAVLGHTDPDEGLVLDPSIPRARQIQWSWIAVGDLSVNWAYSLDPLSAVMLLVVTGVGFLIHVYSVGYMAHEEGFERFFSYLNLFMAMMLVLVLADSFLVMFVGWEGVGLCSYLLIGFNYRDMFNPQRNQSCADAGRKAFIVNRIGDFGFMLGMLLILVTFGSLDFGPVFRGVHVLVATPGSQALLTTIALLLFVGLAARCHGRPHTGFGPDPRRHHGHCRRLHGVPLRRPVHRGAHRPHHGGRGGRSHGPDSRHDRLHPDGHQEGAGLLNRQSTGLHVPGRRGGRLLLRHLPRHDPCLLQGPALPGRRLGDSRPLR